jgi:hypothetical protein
MSAYLVDGEERERDREMRKTACMCVWMCARVGNHSFVLFLKWKKF